MTAIMNLITVAYFCKAIYYSIFKYLSTASFKTGDFFGLIFTYFNIKKTNS